MGGYEGRRRRKVMEPFLRRVKSASETAPNRFYVVLIGLSKGDLPTSGRNLIDAPLQVGDIGLVVDHALEEGTENGEARIHFGEVEADGYWGARAMVKKRGETYRFSSADVAIGAAERCTEYLKAGNLLRAREALRRISED